MKKYFFLICWQVLFAGNTYCQFKDDPKLESVFDRDSVKILVTDSGLGGLSIAADLYEKLKTSGLFKKVDIVFFNAQPHAKSGYNKVDSRDQKVWIFNNALEAIEKKIHPDIILIGCNTLSVIYDYTKFSKQTEIPVYGIVNAGVDLIKSKIKPNNGKVIIFATETTVDEGKHKNELIANNISEDRIIAVPCPKLAGSIERDSESRATDSLVNVYVLKSIEQLKNSNHRQPIFVSYNCTHYGYVDNLFQKNFDKYDITVEEFLNPNPYMTDFLFDKKYLNRFPATEVKVQISSQAELTPDKIGSIYNLIEKVSPETADVLLFYNFLPDFFEWEIEKNSSGQK